MTDSDERVWVFGYGSLIWRADFPYVERKPVVLTHWARRFWQGSHDHRGLPHAPGRVVTLVPEPNARCIGVAYHVDHAVFEYLDHREKNGYSRQHVVLEDNDGSSFDAVVYIAPLGNHAFLGPASLDEMAEQIAFSSGPSGTNRDYLFELATALRVLGADDPHVFELESAVRRRIAVGRPLLREGD
jgi:cation transport protein ChaC